MKKIYLTLALVAVAAISANAKEPSKFYVGGSLGLSYLDQSWNEKQHEDSYSITNSTTSFQFTPEVGYRINEKMDAGLALKLAPGNTTSKTTYNGETTTKTDANFSWAIAPYYRYRFFEKKGFGIWLQGGFALGCSNPNVSSFGYDFVGSYANLNYSVSIVPVLTYDLNDKFELISTLGFLELGYAGSTQWYDLGENSKATTSTNSFVFGLNGNTMLSIGVLYHF